jgi:oligogalacturonide lyase
MESAFCLDDSRGRTKSGPQSGLFGSIVPASGEMTRRTLLSFIPCALLASETTKSGRPRAASPAHSEFFRFADSVTENPVVRLTEPNHQSFIPEPGNRFVSSREGFLIFSSNREGVFHPCRANLRSGVITQLGETKHLAPRSLCLDSKERELYYIDDGSLKTLDLRRGKPRTLLENVSDYHIAGHGNTLVFRSGGKLSRWTPDRTNVLADYASSRGLVNPLENGCVFSRQQAEGENEFWFVSFSGEKPRLLAKGNISYPYWRPDGHAVLFLRQVDLKAYVASELCEVCLDGSPEHIVGETSQFASFAPNGDGSVFVGASRSKAQPDIVLLLRSARREMVLCEHRATRAESVCPVFSPNSQRVYFQSNREGNSSLYSVNVERLVEQTAEF